MNSVRLFDERRLVRRASTSPVRSAAGPPAIVCSSEGATLAQAVKNGVQVAEEGGLRVRPPARTCDGDPVERGEQVGEVRLRRGEVVQHRDRVGDERAQRAIVSFSPIPRPARPSPKLIVLFWIAVRVFRSNMLNSSSMSTGSRVWVTGIVAPALQRLARRCPFPVPGTSVRSPRPTARSPSCRRAAARTLFSSLSSAIAVMRPVVGSLLWRSAS